MNWYWGDLHCHTNLSYGRGTIERAYEIARTHLDFCSVTGHAFWPDMPDDLQHQDDVITMHVGGFAKCRRYWPQLLELTDRYRRDGLVAFPSFEWHSNRYGDAVLLSKEPQLALAEAQSVQDFERHFAPGDHLLIPHHIGYTAGQRGIDWAAYQQSRLGGLIEVYSNHGCAISDESPFDYFHTMGPRDGTKTMAYGLQQGIRCGFIGSTDSHDGFPGHYSHGRVGVLAEAKTPEAIWAALQSRRTVAATGAKIISDFRVDSAELGDEIKAPGARRIEYSLQGNQPFRQVQIVKNGRVIHQDGNPNPRDPSPSGIYVCKIEWGWGRKEQVVDWECSLRMREGSLLGVEPCFRHTAFDTSTNSSPHEITEQSATTLRWRSRTRGVPDAFVHNPETMTSGVNAIVVRLQADAGTALELHSNVLDLQASWDGLQRGSVVAHAAGHRSPAIRVRRPYAIEACRVAGHFTDAPTSDVDYYYLWGAQIDGESIWVTPIWATR